MMKKLITLLFLCGGLLQAQTSCINFSPIINTTRFILVVDVSGSMNGNPIEDAKKGLIAFVDRMDNSDAAAMITFNHSVSLPQTMTTNKGTLKNAIHQIQSGGGTHLYDAVAKAINISKSYNEKVAIILLSDGQDGGSQFTARNIESMVGYHGVAFYGIGLGSVNEKALKTLADKTSGQLKLTPNSHELRHIYEQTLDVYKLNHVSNVSTTGQLLVHSMPAGKSVFMEGHEFGKTPLKISNISPGEYEIKVMFDAGPWKCTGKFQAGKAGFVKAIESEVDKNIAVITIPHGSAVFLDDEFQGYASDVKTKVETEMTGFIFKKKTKHVDYSKELILENVPRGKHVLTIVPFSDSEISSSFTTIEHTFTMGSENLVLHMDARNGNTTLETTTDKLKPKINRHEIDPSSVFDDF